MLLTFWQVLFVSKNELKTKKLGTPKKVPNDFKILYSSVILNILEVCCKTTDIARMPLKPSNTSNLVIVSLSGVKKIFLKILHNSKNGLNDNMFLNKLI